MIPFLHTFIQVTMFKLFKIVQIAVKKHSYSKNYQYFYKNLHKNKIIFLF